MSRQNSKQRDNGFCEPLRAILETITQFLSHLKRKKNNISPEVSRKFERSSSRTSMVLEGIDLRDEALKFAGHVRQTQSPAYFVPEAQNVAGQEVPLQEIQTFLDNVLDRFLPRRDPYATHAELSRIAFASSDGQMGKSEAYAKACILLIGHADLFRQFELLLHDGRIDGWRVEVRERFRREMDTLQRRCRLTLQAILIRPENLTADHRDCIERLFLSELDGPAEINKMVDGLNRYPKLYSGFVVDGLKRKLDVLLEMSKFVSDYFEDVSAHAGVQL